MTRFLVAALVVALAGPAAAAPCNRHEEKRSAALGRAIPVGATLFLEGQHPPVKVEKVRFIDAGKERLKRFKKLVVNGGLEPDLRRAWVQKTPGRFANLAPLAGCKLRGRPAARDFTKPPNPPKSARLVVAGHCAEGDGLGRIAASDEAWTLQGTRLPFCVPLEKGAFRGDRSAPEHVAPWQQSRALWLVAELDEIPERSVELRLEVTVWAHADPQCNACQTDGVDCTAGTTSQTRKRTVKVVVDERGFAAVPVFELESMLDDRAEHVAIEGALWTSGEDLARVRREIHWSRCP